MYYWTHLVSARPICFFTIKTPSSQKKVRDYTNNIQPLCSQVSVTCGLFAKMSIYWLYKLCNHSVDTMFISIKKKLFAKNKSLEHLKEAWAKNEKHQQEKTTNVLPSAKTVRDYKQTLVIPEPYIKCQMEWNIHYPVI